MRPGNADTVAMLCALAKYIEFSELEIEEIRNWLLRGATWGISPDEIMNTIIKPLNGCLGTKFELTDTLSNQTGR